MRFYIDELEVLFPYDYIYPEQLEYMRNLKRSLMKGHCMLEMPTGTGKTITLLSLILSYQYAHPEVGKLVYCTRTVHEMNKVIDELKGLMEFRKKELAKDQAVLDSMYAVHQMKNQMQSRYKNENNTNMTDDNNPSMSNIKNEDDETSVVIHQKKVSTLPYPKIRSPDILAVCLTSRRNLCVHEIVSQFDHREKVDSLCRSMTAPFAREEKINRLSNRTNASSFGTNASTSNSMPTSISQSGEIVPTQPSLSRQILPPPDIEDLSSVGLCQYYEGLQSASEISLSGIFSIDDMKALGRQKKWCPYFTARKLISDANVVVYNYHYMLDPKIAGMISKEIEAESIIVFDEAHNIDNICIEALSIIVNKSDIYSASRNLNKLHRLVYETEEHAHEKLKNEYNNLISGLVTSGVLSDEVADIASTPLLPDDIQQESVPGSIRKAKHFVMFIKTFVEYLKRRFEGKDIMQQTPAAFIQHFQLEAILSDTSALKFSFDRLSMLLRTLEITDVDEYNALLKITSLATLSATYTDGFVVLYEPFDDNDLPDARLQLCCVDSSLAIRPIFEKFSTVIITSGTLSPLHMFPTILSFEPIVSASFTMSLSRDLVLPLFVVKGNDQNYISSSFSAREEKGVSTNYGQLLISLSRTIPDGMVCFFTSYLYMERIIAEWNQLGILDTLASEKLIFVETKDIEETSLALTAYRKACLSGRGAIFFSVARGKVSEGIDFSGPLGRAVVLLGVPYQYTRSRVLLARLEFLKEKYNVSESEFLHFDALRQASQCLGRIVRSKKDYGVMVLADHRYSQNNIRTKLPKWIQQCIHPDHIALSMEGAINASRSFLRTLAIPHDEKDDIGKILLDAQMAQSQLYGLTQSTFIQVSHGVNMVDVSAGSMGGPGTIDQNGMVDNKYKYITADALRENRLSEFFETMIQRQPQQTINHEQQYQNEDSRQNTAQHSLSGFTESIHHTTSNATTMSDN